MIGDRIKNLGKNRRSVNLPRKAGPSGGGKKIKVKDWIKKRKKKFHKLTHRVILARIRVSKGED